MLVSEFANPVQAVGQGANVVGDDRIPDGVQWRASLGRGFLLPAGPVVLHRCLFEAGELHGDTAAVSSRPLPAEVTPRSPLALFPIRWSGRRPCWVEVVGDGRLRVAITAPSMGPSRQPVELAAVDEPPYRVGSFAMGGVLVTGEGRVDDIRVWFLDPDTVVETTRVGIDALPDDYLGAFTAYALPNGGDQESWKDRILAAAPAAAVPYAPVPPDAPYRPDFELARVNRLVRAEASVDAWVRRAYDAADASRDDLVIVAEPELGPHPVRGRHRASESLAMAAIDPGVSRWLARTGTVRVDLSGGPDDLALLVAQAPGLFHGPPGERSDFGGEPGRLYNEALDRGWRELLDNIEDIPDPSGERTLQAKLLNVPIAISLATPAARPAPLELTRSGDPSWYADAAAGETGWRQSIALRGVAAPVGPVSLEQVGPDQRRTLHPLVGDDSDVAAPMSAAWPPKQGAPTVTATVPVAAGDEASEVTWRVHAGDWTGRWSDPVELTGGPPPRPTPGGCTLEAWYTPGSSPPTGLASTGDVRLSIRFEPTGLPGSVPVDRIQWTVDGVSEDPIELTAMHQVDGLRAFRDVPAPETSPGESKTIRFTAVAIDLDGGRSSEASVTVVVADPRPLPALRIGPRLMPTSRPTADPEVSITLTASGVPEGGAVRFLFANETAVRAALGLPTQGFRTTPRYERAETLRQAGGGPQRAYSAALPDPVRAVGGRATATLRFPAGSNDLILVRALPVATTTDAAGIVKETASTPFAATQPAFVAVPTSDAPALPRISASATPSGRITVDVAAPHVSTARFGGGPPEARIVQVVEDMPPAFWPEVAALVLARRGDEWTGRLTLPAVEWARVGLAASVRFPAEPLLAPGAVASPGDLIAPGPASAGSAMRAPWGPVGAPAWLELRGRAPRVDAAIEADGSWRVEVRDLPPARDGSPGFAAELYRGTSALILDSVHALDATIPSFTVGPFPGQEGGVVLVDPFGGRSAVFELPA
ncbi:hypothetical protein [Agromyces sp. GXS1127]|uniref:hypothetical protein n=1 Tax=Agromyces sp. GXS1127 TaxID=3424181 RepID=UPI003D318EB6